MFPFLLLPHPVVLVGRDGCKLRLLEDKSLEIALRCVIEILASADVHHVEPWLVTVHRVQDYLRTTKQDLRSKNHENETLARGLSVSF